jgi:hypothetical protein
MNISPSFAIYYAGDAYSTANKIMGRQSAGKAFMRGVARTWPKAQLQGLGQGTNTAKAMYRQLAADGFEGLVRIGEMEPDVVANYLHHVDRLQSRWVLLRNMREGKQIQKDGHVGVKTPIRSDDYVHMLPNYQLVARNVHPFGYETVDGFHSELQLFKRK